MKTANPLFLDRCQLKENNFRWKTCRQAERPGQKGYSWCCGYFPCAAAGEQLTQEPGRSEIIGGQDGADPASVVYDAVAAAKARNADVLICDTAGRLTQRRILCGRASQDLPHSGEGILRKRIWKPWWFWMERQWTERTCAGRQFAEVANVTGIILTKLDGTAGGVLRWQSSLSLIFR